MTGARLTIAAGALLGLLETAVLFDRTDTLFEVFAACRVADRRAFDAWAPSAIGLLDPIAQESFMEDIDRAAARLIDARRQRRIDVVARAAMDREIASETCTSSLRNEAEQ